MRCFVKKVFIEISQNSQENTCARARPQASNLLKKKLCYRCFPVNFAKFLRTPFLTEHLLWSNKMKKVERWFFKDPLLFSYGSTNSCGVAISFCGLKSLHIIDKKYDKSGRMLTLDAKVNCKKFLLLNLYQSKTGSEQIKTLARCFEIFTRRY